MVGLGSDWGRVQFGLRSGLGMVKLGLRSGPKYSFFK